MRWIVCVDFTDGNDRESWSVFYTDMFVADTEEEAKWLGDYALAAWMNEEYDENEELPDWGGYEVFEESSHEDI